MKMEKTASKRKAVKACSKGALEGEDSNKMPRANDLQVDKFVFQSGAMDSNTKTSSCKDMGQKSETPTDSTDSPKTSESAVNIIESYITIETKSGKSSKKIPLSHFLKNVAVDKHSGTFSLNLEEFLDAQNRPYVQPQCHSETRSLESHKAGNKISSKNSLKEESNPKMSSETSLLTVRNPNINSLKSCELDQTKPFDLVNIDEKQCPEKKLKTPVSQAPRRSSRVPAKSKRFADDFVSTVTPGKTHSLKSSSCLSPSPSTSSKLSWNTQLMTLALAAETHQTSSQGDGSNNPHSKLQDNNMDIEPTEEAIVLVQDNKNSKQVNLPKSEEACPTQKTFLAKEDKAALEEILQAPVECQVISADLLDEKVAMYVPKSNMTTLKDAQRKLNRYEGASKGEDIGKLEEKVEALDCQCAAEINGKTKHNTCTSINIQKISQNPQSSHEQQSTKPVAKKSLVEAMITANEATRTYIYTQTSGQSEEKGSSEMTSSHIYYTIMEPKTESQGQCLLVKKNSDKIDFNVAEITETPSDKTATISKSFPQDRLFSCKNCERVFTSSSSWLQHQQTVHSQPDDSVDSIAEKTSSEKHQCKFCRQRFPYKFMLELHIKRKRHSEMKHFRCTLCRENFFTHGEREEHWAKAHEARTCKLCGKQVDNIVMLRRHIGNNCHGARFRKQTENLKGEGANEAMFSSPQIAESIFKTSEKPEAYKYTDRKIHNLNEFNKIHLSGESKSLQKERSKQETSVGSMQPTVLHKLRCQVCSNSFYTYSGLWKHMIEKHKQFYPQGFKEKLLERLEKNQVLLANTENAFHEKSASTDKSKYFIVMNQKIANPRIGLSVFSEENQFSFKPRGNKDFEMQSTEDKSSSESSNSKQIVFNCSQCKVSFSFASDFRDHCSKIHGKCFEGVRLLGAFQCTLCSDSFPCQFMLDKHLKKHVGKKLLPCTLCGLQFHKIQERRQHWKSAHPGIGCPNCGKMYASIKYLQKHISLNCQDHFPPSQKFLEFQKKQHNDFEMDEDYKRVEKKILRCHLCPKICSSVHGWRRHMTEAHENIGFSKLSNTCIICGLLVYGYKALEKHILEKHAEDSGLPVDEENKLVELAVKKSDKNITEYKTVGKDTAKIIRDEFGNYQCPSCPKTHPELRAIKTHMRTHVDMELECNQCGKTFKNPSLLKQHIQRHRKEAIYKCETCEKSFPTLLKLNKHCKVHHAKGNFVCELCGASFALNEYLQKHRKCHNDIRPHVCSICAKTFRTKPELRVHFLIHTRETPYTCQYCGRGFSQRGNYRTHLAQHTGVKPYQCDRCPLSFALKCHLTRHLATHDQLIQYRCLWCDKECTQRKHMKMHVLRVHQEDFTQHEEAMKLDTPTPIPESQVRLYNRRPVRASKIRRQYRTKAEKCDTAVINHPEISSDSVAQNIVGLPVKPLPIEIKTDKSIIHVEGMEGQTMVSCVIPQEVSMEVSEERNGGETNITNFEVLVSGGSGEDHQVYTKSGVSINGAVLPSGLLLQENMQLVVGENNEISIIIKSEEDLHKNLGEHQGFEAREVHPALQDAIAMLASPSQSAEVKEVDTGVALAIVGLDKQGLTEDNHILNFVPESGEDL